MAGVVIVGECRQHRRAKALRYSRTSLSCLSRRSCPSRRSCVSSLQHLREPEIQNLDRAVGPQLDVRGLQVSMDHALLVGRLERLADLTSYWQRLVEWNSSLADPSG